MLKGLMDKLLGRPLDYDEAKRLARHDDPKVRTKLAKREDLKPEILYFLAEDPEASVRQAIARNAATPRQADLLLTGDADQGVRKELAEKIGRLIPGLSVREVEKIRDLTHDVLKRLAEDEAVRVRQVLSETLKDIADAPPDVIGRLARDVEIVVSAPVLEYSPVLTDDDLLDIIQHTPEAAAVQAISRRRGLTEAVTDAIYDYDDADAITAMLANTSTQIREVTLDLIVERAEKVEAWHAPLVSRPKLSSSAVSRLAEFVADNLLNTLQSRSDMDSDTAQAVAKEFRRRMEAGAKSKSTDRTEHKGARAATDMDSKDPKTRAQEMMDAGTLDGDAISAAASRGDQDFVVAALAAKTDIAPGVIESILDMGSEKGIVALCWKANLPMPVAVVLQTRIAKIPPNAVQGSVDGGYPFTEEEMSWQLDFFKDMA